MSNKNPDVKTESTLDANQQAISNQIKQFLSGKIGQGGTPYEGELTAPIPSEFELAFGDVIDAYKNLDLSGSYDALSKMISGTPNYAYDPSGVANEWSRSIVNPAMTTWREDVMPQIETQYNLPGTFHSTEKARAVEQSAQSLYEQSLLPTLFQSQQAERQRAFESGERAADRQMPAMEMQSSLAARAVEPMMQMAMMRQMMKQEELNRAYQEFMRMAPESDPWLQHGMGYIKVPTTTSYGIPGKSWTEDFANIAGAASIVGEMFG